MCGRYYRTADKQAIAEWFHVAFHYRSLTTIMNDTESSGRFHLIESCRTCTAVPPVLSKY